MMFTFGTVSALRNADHYLSPWTDGCRVIGLLGQRKTFEGLIFRTFFLLFSTLSTHESYLAFCYLLSPSLLFADQESVSLSSTMNSFLLLVYILATYLNTVTSPGPPDTPPLFL